MDMARVRDRRDGLEGDDAGGVDETHSLFSHSLGASCLLNLTLPFIAFFRSLEPLSRSLPLVVHHRENIVKTICATLRASPASVELCGESILEYVTRSFRSVQPLTPLIPVCFRRSLPIYRLYSCPPFLYSSRLSSASHHHPLSSPPIRNCCSESTMSWERYSEIWEGTFCLQVMLEVWQMSGRLFEGDWELQQRWKLRRMKLWSKHPSRRSWRTQRRTPTKTPTLHRSPRRRIRSFHSSLPPRQKRSLEISEPLLRLVDFSVARSPISCERLVLRLVEVRGSWNS